MSLHHMMAVHAKDTEIICHYSDIMITLHSQLHLHALNYTLHEIW
jgi:hypothetical protein